MKYAITLILLILAVGSAPANAKGKFGIDAYALTKAVCYQGARYKSTFQQGGNRQWRESAADGGQFTWQERNRDEWSVYLVDNSRRMNLQIDLHTTIVSWSSFGQSQRNEICRVKQTNSAQRQQPYRQQPQRSQSQQEICASMIQGRVAWSRGGSKTWSPTNVNKLCKGTSNASKTVQCFKNEINSHNNWQKGIQNCSGTKRAINAGPIWNQQDAKRKCPQIARQNGGTWTGGWWTTVQGKMSVCEVKF